MTIKANHENGETKTLLIKSETTKMQPLFKEALLESVPNPIFYKDINGRYLGCNRAFEKLMNIERELIIGKTAHEVWPKKYADVYMDTDIKLLQTGGTQTYEFKIETPKGEIRDVVFFKSTFANTDGTVGGLIGSILDITDHKTAQKASFELKKAEMALQTNEMRYLKAQQMGKVGNWEYNLKTKLFWGSDEAKRIYGFDIEQEELSTDAVESCIPERERVHQALIDLIKKGQEYNLEFEIRPINSSNPKIISSIAELQKDDNGEPYLVAGVIQDITERKKAEKEKAELEAINMQLKKAESLGIMAGAIAHHYNNMLAAIIGNLELALDYQKHNIFPIDEITESLKAARRASDIGKQMLAYLGHQSGQRKVIEFIAVFRQCISDIIADIPNNITIESNIPTKDYQAKDYQTEDYKAKDYQAEAHQVKGYQAKDYQAEAHQAKDYQAKDYQINGNVDDIRQLLHNIIVNAVDAIGDRDGVISISLKSVIGSKIPSAHRFPLKFEPESTKQYVCIEVKDNGCGIESAEIEKLFDPFYSTKFTGRGLGLAVALGIAKAHEGCIAIKSILGKGTIFAVYLPQFIETPVVSKSSENMNLEGNSLEERTVLLVDDEQAVRKMCNRMLSRFRIKTIEAKDGVEAVELFKLHKDKIDCVLSDLTMPRLDGWETIKALRKISPDVKVILSSGYDQSHVMAGEHHELPQAFLTKPYSVAALKDALIKAMGLRESFFTLNQA